MRALTPSAFAELELAVGRRFSFDAHTVHAGFDSVCNLGQPSCRPLSSVDLGGHTVLFVPLSMREMQTQLAHYRSCKQLHPETSACLLLPTYLARRASRLLAGMSLLRRFTKGTVLFNGQDLAGSVVVLPALPYSVDVWYDLPAPSSTPVAPFL